ncbi:MAG: hypothetical protein RID07_17310, partial [Lacipirellulaceae bacterium]
TLNLLIQGAAMHSFLTSHHLVKGELESLKRGITRRYDTLSVSFALIYFWGDPAIVFGLPTWFWNRTHKPKHPFYHHRLLATRGKLMWKESKRYLVARGWKKWVIAIPGLHYAQQVWLFLMMLWSERKLKPELARLCERANSEMWGIPEDRLEAHLTTDVAFGNLHTPRTVMGKAARAAAIGYGGVVRRRDQFQVVAKSWTLPLVMHELTKGIAELVCLHGLNELDDDMYRKVTEEADQLEYETWMLQAGSEMWRRFLAAMPDQQDLPTTLMNLARLEPRPLESIMLAVVDDTKRAQAMLREFG